MTSQNVKLASQDSGDDGGEWGWSALGSEDDTAQTEHDEIIVDRSTVKEENVEQDEGVKSPGPEKAANGLRKYPSDPKHIALSIGNMSLQKGITSSPSFQELERAIGATLQGMSLNGSAENLESTSESQRNIAYHGGMGYAHNSPRSFGSNMNTLAQQKRQHQILKMQRQQMYSRPIPSPMSTPTMPFAGSPTGRAELGESFINEDESRAIILFHSHHISAVTIREACQKFGVLYYIRPEFHSKGVTLLSYFDLRSAVHAHASLAEDLGVEAEASAHYSVMLHATNNNSEEFRLVVRHLPPGRVEADVQSIFSRYGELRSIQRTFESEDSDTVDQSGSGSAGAGTTAPSGVGNSTTSYSVEYYNIQDARLAASELCATSAQLWGPETAVTFAPLDSRKQLLCRKLLATLSRWRAELATTTYPTAPSYQMPVTMMSPQHMYSHQAQFGGPVEHVTSGSNMPLLMHPGYMGQMVHQMPVQMMQYGMPMYQHQLSPVQHAGFPVDLPSPPGHMRSTSPKSLGQQGRETMSSHPPKSTAVDGQTFKFAQSDIQRDQERILLMQQQFKNSKTGSVGGSTSVPSQLVQPPAYQRIVSTGATSGRTTKIVPLPGLLSQVPGSYEQRPHHHNGGHGHNRRPTRLVQGNIGASLGGGPVEAEFTLDTERLMDGVDMRTTVMVRNIPNKYNQQMLLEEVNVNHEGTYDFFYLPIDFKNKCNVGYCFINFLEPRHIVPFVAEFNGQRWKSFNSEKVCAVSFARIQGKSAMVSRFQNSSLLEKDDEYRPLLFFSSGPDKGKSEPFPVGNRHRSQGRPDAARADYGSGSTDDDMLSES